MSNTYYSKTTTSEVVTQQHYNHHNPNVASRTVVANPYTTNSASQSLSTTIRNVPKQPCVTPVANRKIPSRSTEDLYIHTHHKQIVPMGKKRKVDVQDEDDNSVGTVMPRVFATERELPDNASALAQMTYNDHDRVTNLTWTIANPSVLKTTINVEGYTNYITDPDYIRKRHEIINGKIHEWRKATNDLLTRVESDDVMQDIYQPWCFVRQQTWVDKKVGKMMYGIEQYTKMPVDVLHKKALLQHVHGIDSEEEADFVFNICSSEEFKLIVKPMENTNDFTIMTVFDTGYTKGYGKTIDHKPSKFATASV
jgi:hypothetical protein